MTFISCLAVVLFFVLVPVVGIIMLAALADALNDNLHTGAICFFLLFILWCAAALHVATNVGPIVFNTDCQMEHIEEFETEGGVSI